ncbi:hypothetical protein QBC39DRAFT_327850 [Podospora conica]|nr:hypothetical protein QBC39DRAFT_327850 [Schizothecium conicum]
MYIPFKRRLGWRARGIVRRTKGRSSSDSSGIAYGLIYIKAEGTRSYFYDFRYLNRRRRPASARYYSPNNGSGTYVTGSNTRYEVRASNGETLIVEGGASRTLGNEANGTAYLGAWTGDTGTNVRYLVEIKYTGSPSKTSFRKKPVVEGLEKKQVLTSSLLILDIRYKRASYRHRTGTSSKVLISILPVISILPGRELPRAAGSKPNPLIYFTEKRLDTVRVNIRDIYIPDKLPVLRLKRLSIGIEIKVVKVFNDFYFTLTKSILKLEYLNIYLNRYDIYELGVYDIPFYYERDEENDPRGSITNGIEVLKYEYLVSYAIRLIASTATSLIRPGLSVNGYPTGYKRVSYRGLAKYRADYLITALSTSCINTYPIPELNTALGTSSKVLTSSLLGASKPPPGTILDIFPELQDFINEYIFRNPTYLDRFTEKIAKYVRLIIRAVISRDVENILEKLPNLITLIINLTLRELFSYKYINAPRSLGNLYYLNKIKGIRELPDNLNINLAKFKYRNVEEQARFEVLLKILQLLDVRYKRASYRLQGINGHPTGYLITALSTSCKVQIRILYPGILPGINTYTIPYPTGYLITALSTSLPALRYKRASYRLQGINTYPIPSYFKKYYTFRNFRFPYSYRRYRPSPLDLFTEKRLETVRNLRVIRVDVLTDKFTSLRNPGTRQTYLFINIVKAFNDFYSTLTKSILKLEYLRADEFPFYYERDEEK